MCEINATARVFKKKDIESILKEEWVPQRKFSKNTFRELLAVAQK